MRIIYWSSDVCSSDLNLFGNVELTGKIAIEISGAHRAIFRDIGHGRFAIAVMRKPLLGGFDDFLARGVGCVLTDDRSGRASCRERGCKYGLILEVAGSLKKKI